MSRISGTRKLEKVVAIIGEGITEYFYFNDFKESEVNVLRGCFIVKPDKPQHSDFRRILAKAEVLLKKGYDKVFCVIDMDYILSSKSLINEFNSLKRKYTNESKLCFIESNPCFELWFLLHFKYSTRQFENEIELVRELKKEKLMAGYEKTFKYFSSNNIYENLKSKLENAILNSELLDDDKVNYNSSYSQVYRIFKELIVKKI